MSEEEIGVITHYFEKVNVAAIEVNKGELHIGDTIHIKGHTSDFTTTIESMQIEHNQVEKATEGEAVGLKVPERVRVHDKVYKVTE